MNVKDLDMKVVKDNVLINASYGLELVEQRLILLAIIEARESGKGINANDPLTVHASAYIQNFCVEKHSAYKSLKDACKTLFARQFSYEEINKNGNTTHFTSRWVSKIGYTNAEATIQLIFSPDVVPLITRLEKHFTSYELEQVAQLQSKYATRLYELLISWRSIGFVSEISLEDFRNRIGVNNGEYKILANFKARVLEPAIKQINEHTDITATYIQHKQGRIVTGFSFKFKQKSKTDKKVVQKDQNTIDMFESKVHQDKFIKMSDAQLDTFSGKLSELHEIQQMAHIGEDMKPFTARLRSMLKDTEQQIKLQPYLEQVGFKLGKS